jgi:tetratricopeptide (TPR) repeat protein
MLSAMQAPLSSGQPAAARPIWEAAATRAPEAAAVHREGARLALALDDLETAEERAWAAVLAAPEDGLAWALLGQVQLRLNKRQLAQQAYANAVAFAPELAPDLFATRWQLARQLEDTDQLTVLAQGYVQRNPEDELGLYYRAEALLAGYHNRAALDLLLLGIEDNAPAVLWYTLARTYLRLGAEAEAAVCLETALTAYNRGDQSMALASDDPTYDLHRALAVAYLGSGACENVAPRIALLATPYPDLHPLLEQGMNCPEITPTPTPWLPSDWHDSD